MPTYQNLNPTPVVVNLGIHSGIIRPGASLETLKLLDHYEGLRRTSDLPFHNPTKLRYFVEGAKDDIAEIDVDYREIRDVNIITDGCIDVYLNHLDNTPPLKVMCTAPINIETSGSIEKFHIKFISSCKVDLTYFTHRHKIV
jgi:hypothetical protein